jgi:hypothetical protein
MGIPYRAAARAAFAIFTFALFTSAFGAPAEPAPLVFEGNAGQTDKRVDFLARGANWQLFLAGPHATVKLVRREAGGPRMAAVRLHWLGARDGAAGAGLDELPAHANYIHGASTTSASTYERVRYAELYPGVDLLYYAKQGQLEYDLRVAPGADASRIRFAVEGTRHVALDAQGNLVARTIAGELRIHGPRVHQTVEGELREIEARFEHDPAGGWRIALGEYDSTRELVIDPVLTYGSYLGGSGQNQAQAIAVDAAGNAYVTGYTTSTDFPVVSAYRSTLTGSADTDAFVTKFNAAGTGLAYSTYLGAIPARKSSTASYARAIAVDAAGSAYVTGTTNSAAFPVTSGAYQAGATGGGTFVTKLAPNGASLAYSTYVLNTTPAGIAVDAAGNAYITGVAQPGFATTASALRRTSTAASSFAASLNAGGTAMRYATFLGGTGTVDSGNAIAVDASGNAYVGGITNSADFPTTAGAYQTALAGRGDGFVAKLNPTGSALVFSTYFGGARNDGVNAIAVDASGATYITGHTYSDNLPIRNAFQPVKTGRTLTNSTLGNAFVAKLLAGGDALAYGSFLGGEVCTQPCAAPFAGDEYGADYGEGIAVDGMGHAFISGVARSYTFPLVDPLIGNRGGELVLQNSAFLAKIGIAGNAVIYNTLTTTDTDFDGNYRVAVDAAGNAYGAGTATAPGKPLSGDLVKPGSYDTSPGTTSAAVVYKLASASRSMTLGVSASPAYAQSPVTLTATSPDAPANVTVRFFDGTQALGEAAAVNGSASLTTTLPAGVRRLTAVWGTADTSADTAMLYAVVNPAQACH